MGACVIGGAAILAGCEGEPPAATPEQTDQLQKNEMEARRKAYGQTGQQTLKGAKAAAKAGAAAPAPAPEAAAPEAK
jgi:hypothetical protein